MIVVTLISFSMILATALFHHHGLCWIACQYSDRGKSRFYALPVTMFGITLLHLAEISAYAILYFFLNTQTDLGGFTDSFVSTIWNYLYFSGANYTTLGLSEFYPTGHFKVLTFTESLNGFLLITWSATFFYSMAGHFKDNIIS